MHGDEREDYLHMCVANKRGIACLICFDDNSITTSCDKSKNRSSRTQPCIPRKCFSLGHTKSLTKHWIGLGGARKKSNVHFGVALSDEENVQDTLDMVRGKYRFQFWWRLYTLVLY